MAKDLPPQDLRRIRKIMKWTAAVAGTFFAGLLIASFIETIGLMPSPTTNSGANATAETLPPADTEKSR
ncbi:hypothetical protein [Mesorhizobium sp. A556]